MTRKGTDLGMRHRTGHLLLSLMLLAALRGAVQAEEKPVSPRVFALNPSLLAVARSRAAAGDPALAPVLAGLRKEADKSLKAGPFSVMDKEKTPPSGEKHDYLTQAPYWWPDPNKPDGLPYINRDGETNPESRKGNDDLPFGRLCSNVYTLALAYYFTGHEPYAEKAAALMKAWFLDPASKMNPNLNFAQGIPGRNTGRGTGIIESRDLLKIVDSVGLLEGSPAWTKESVEGMRAWFRAYLEWMLTSKNGQAEAKATNNHGTWYQAQVGAFALFTGDEAKAKAAVEAGKEMIARQIEPDGGQPLELKRTKSFHYTLFNLSAFFTLGEIGQRIGEDLYNYQTDAGRSIRKALDFAAPYYDLAKKWPYKEIKPDTTPNKELAELLRRAAIVYGDKAYEDLLEKVDKEGVAASRVPLLWPWPPEKGEAGKVRE